MFVETVIDDNKWKEVKALLLDVLDLDRSARASYLGKQEISPEVRDEVESLLAFEDEAEELLQDGAIGLSKEIFANDAENHSPLTGQDIGAYTIVSELGIGGMGAVYLADRRDGKFEQKVAIKLLKREYNAGKIRESFKREIEIQSKLVHPNIATMLDTGTTDDGIPYIVMEYVEGLAIDKYCRDNDLGLIDRLKIFNRACDAVAFAHQNLIVHRDLKPSNIIVTAKGNPKLLDFGISRLLGDSGIEASNITLMGAMTPEYASPEQINGSPISTATDIYSLGVILFKLLTGTYPYNIKNRVNGDMLREITGSEPLLSSYAAAMERQTAVSPAWLKGDIDNILLKSLEKEPEHRYRTVEQFAEDIWRFIDGEPVSARPATLSYRLKKFYGRNRIVAIAGSLIFVSILVGSVIAFWQANVARAQANIATEARNAAILESDRAKVEQAKSEKISKFMANLISYANGAWYGEGAKFGGDARVIDALLEMSDKIDVEFAGDPDVAAELHHKFGEAIGWAYPSGVDKDLVDLLRKRQQFHLLRALELRVQFYGEWHELVAKDLFYSYLLIGKNDTEHAALLDRSLNMMRDSNANNLNFPYIIEGYTARLMLPDSPETHEAYLKAVTPATDENKYQIAERYLRESLPVFRLHYKEDNRSIFGAECKLAYTLVRQEKWTDFDKHYAICRESQVKPQDSASAKILKSYIDQVDKALVEKMRLK